MRIEILHWTPRIDDSKEVSSGKELIYAFGTDTLRHVNRKVLTWSVSAIASPKDTITRIILHSHRQSFF